MKRQTALWLMLLCLLVAAALRLPELVNAPPGLHYDEAANGILAGDIGLRGERPIFIASYTGKEVLFFYLAGSLMNLVGESVFTLRLASAFIGLLTVATTYWLSLELLRDRRIALVAAALLAVSFWHILFSRLGFRAIGQPLLQALTVAALFRGFRRDSWRWFIVAGLGVGLTGYTYLAARIFPIPLALAFVPLLFNRQSRPRRLKQLALFTVTGLIVLSPLIIYFISNPDAFWVRVDQVLPGGGPSTTSASNYLRSLGMFFLAGDPYWRFNIPERPLFNYFWGGLFITGWVYALLRLAKRLADWQKAAYLLLVLIPPFMILPTALASGEIVPSNLRAIGLLPFIYLLPSLFLVAFLDFIKKPAADRVRKTRLRVPVPSPATIVMGVFLLVLAIGGLTAGRDYFQNWSTRTDLYYESDADLVAVSDYLASQDAAGDTIYLAALHYRHPTVAFLSDRYQEIKWLPESEALVFPADGSALYIYPHNSPPPEWALEYLEEAAITEGPIGPDGMPTFLVYELPAGGGVEKVTQGADLVEANFDNTVTLMGYEAGSAAGGQSLPLTLFWRVDRLPTADILPFVHLEDAWGYRWGQVEPFAYPAEQWEPGDFIVQRVDVPLRPGLPPGSYRIKVGFFDPASDQQLVRLDEAGGYAGNALAIDDVVVSSAPPPVPAPQPPYFLNQPAAPGLTLLGYERGGQAVAAGADFPLALWWLAGERLEAMSIQLALVRMDGAARILLDTHPVHDSYPFVNWSPPQLVIDRQAPKIPADFPPGDYQLLASLLSPEGEERFLVDLGSLTVEATDRLFTAPEIEKPLAATFGEEILLLGYDLQIVDSEQFGLTLFWQALTEPAASFKVFVHVLDLDGNCCIWQSDDLPKQGQYPTDRWLAGEIVVDPYLLQLPLELPAGQYPVEIGLYIPETGQRLQVVGHGQPANDALFLSPLEVE